MEVTQSTDEPHHFTYQEWREWVVKKIVTMGLQHTPAEHVDDYLQVQIGAAIDQALRHGRSGRSDTDPVVS